MAVNVNDSVQRTLDQVQHGLGLTDDEFAAALGVSLCTINCWKHGSIPSDDVHDRFVQLQSLSDHLAASFEPDDINDWMREPHHYLGNKTPSESLANGRTKRVDDLLTVIDYGMFT